MSEGARKKKDKFLDLYSFFFTIPIHGRAHTCAPIYATTVPVCAYEGRLYPGHKIVFIFFFFFFYRLYIFHLFFLYPSISIALCVSLGDRKQLLVSFRSATGRKSSVANHWSISICWLPSHRYIKHTNGSASFITYYAGIKDK